MKRFAVSTFAITALLHIAGCAAEVDAYCYDDDDQPITCEPLGAVPEVAPSYAVESLADVGGADAPADYIPGPDDLDGPGDESIDVAISADAELAAEAVAAKATADGRTDVSAGDTKKAELRKLLPIGRTAGAQRYVIMRLRPSDLPNLRTGDIVRGAAELQVTTACDIGQTGPACGYSPSLRMQLLLSGSPDATDAHGAGTIALSGVEKLSCTANEHHCIAVINYFKASQTLDAATAPPCVANNSCFINLAVWAFDPSARSGGADKLIIGANEGNFLANGNVEQDRGRIMVVRERGITAADRTLAVTKHDVRGGGISMASNGDFKRIYSHTLNHGRDLRAGEKYRVWADVDATSNGRVNLSLLVFLTKNRTDHNGGGIDATNPASLSEHNGTNCSPSAPCHLHKVAVFAVDRDVPGPVYVNIAASTEVPGPGSATTTIQDNGFVKSVRYSH